MSLDINATPDLDHDRMLEQILSGQTTRMRDSARLNRVHDFTLSTSLGLHSATGIAPTRCLIACPLVCSHLHLSLPLPSVSTSVD